MPQPLHEAAALGAAEAPLAARGGELRRHQIYADNGGSFLASLLAHMKSKEGP